MGQRGCAWRLSLVRIPVLLRSGCVRGLCPNTSVPRLLYLHDGNSDSPGGWETV